MQIEALVRPLAAAAVMSACTATGFAQNSPAAPRAGASSAATAAAGAGKRSGDRRRPPGALPADRGAAAASPRNRGPDAGPGTEVSGDGGITRGGPENPSGLKKPD
jgi:hypothetical protein